ncbi:MAG: hypothetical protein KKH94_13985, partial [Candidatus Omnitrophica bacterium]|nr:hypothetical protein [Candidatus Omnitrophota bacterium]
MIRHSRARETHAAANPTPSEGEKVTGNTIAWVTKQLDAGDIVLQKEHPISLFDNFGVLHEILAQKGAKLLLKAIQLIQDTKAPRLP